MDFSLAQLLQVMILLGTGGANGGGYYASKYVVIGMHGGILFLHALINSLSIHWVSYLGTIAAAWNILGQSLTLMKPNHPVSSEDFWNNAEKQTSNFVGRTIANMKRILQSGLETKSKRSEREVQSIDLNHYSDSVAFLVDAGVLVLTITIPAVAMQRATASSVFTSFNKPSGVGINSSPYIFLLGLLMSQYTYTGYDASAHMVK